MKLISKKPRIGSLKNKQDQQRTIKTHKEREKLNIPDKKQNGATSHETLQKFKGLSKLNLRIFMPWNKKI